MQNQLKAVVNENLGVRFFVSHVRAQLVTKTEHYAVRTLEANCGVMTRIFGEESPEEKAVESQLIGSYTFVTNNVLSVESPDRETVFYSIDLNTLVPEGWVLKVERLRGGKPISFGLLAYHPDHADEVMEVHPITNTDFRNEGEPQCNSVMQSTSFSVFPMGVQCEREENHIGNHQAVASNNYTYIWDYLDRPSSGDPYGQYGFKNTCPHCGFVSAGSAEGVRECGTCSFWSDQKAADGGFIIEGRHYRPGRGGFGGAIFHITRNDGSRWSGELFTQGEVPPWLRDRFPDNATFDAGSSMFYG